MKIAEYAIAGTRVLAAVEPADGVATLGVRVHLDLGLALTPALQNMLLETILLRWKAEIGAVTRGGTPQRCFGPGGTWWLPGWKLQVFREGAVLGLTVQPKGEGEDAGDRAGNESAVRGDEVRAGRE